MEGIVLVVKVEYFPREKIYICISRFSQVYVFIGGASESFSFRKWRNKKETNA